MDVQYLYPDAMAPRLEHATDYMFLNSMPEWQNVVRSRLDEKCDSVTMRFLYEEDFHVNDELVEKALGKMKIDKAEKNLLFAEHVARESLTDSGHNRVLLSHSIMSSRHPDNHLGLFEPVRIAVTVEFFSALEYWEFNRGWISANWSSLHVQSFLRLIGLSQYEHRFFDEEVDGETLMAVISNPSETITTSLKMSPEDTAVLKDHVRRLGLPEDLGVLLSVEKEECHVRAEHEKALERMVQASKGTKTSPKGAGPSPGAAPGDAKKSGQRASAGKSSRAAVTGTPIGAGAGGEDGEGTAPFTEGVFEVVMVVSADGPDMHIHLKRTMLP
jgi:hypothetical protein